MVGICRAKGKALDIVRSVYVRSSQIFHNNLNVVMFLVGAVILATGLAGVSEAQINTTKIRCAAIMLLYLTEGDLGALVMVIAGISTIIASAFGAFRAAHALLVVACASFVLRSLVDIWFNGQLNSMTPQQCASQLGGGGNPPG